MAKSYKLHPTVKRVVYPDRSGKELVGDEVVSGDEWAPYAALGYVVEVGDAAAEPAKAAPKKAPKAEIASVAPPPAPEPAPEPAPDEQAAQYSDPRDAQKAARRKRQTPSSDDNS